MSRLISYLLLSTALILTTGCLEDDEPADEGAAGTAGAGAEAGSGGVAGEGNPGGEAGQGGEGGEGEAGQGGEGEAGQGGAPGELDCDAVCAGFESCTDALAIIGDCGDCADVAEALAEAPSPILERTASVCGDALASGDCRAYSACLTDDDGLNGVARGGVSVVMTGQIGGEAVMAMTDDSWAVIGAKGSGDPGDVELYFEVGGVFYGIEFDDLANAAEDAPLDAADYPVEVATGDGATTFEVGEVALAAWALDGEFAIQATLGEEGGDQLTITANGAFE